MNNAILDKYPWVEYVIGIDEVGTGAWAGPFSVAACATKRNWSHPLITDSKAFKLPNAKKRHKARMHALEIINKEVEDTWLVSPYPAQFKDPGTMGYALSRAMAWLTQVATASFPNSLVVIDGLPRTGVRKRLGKDAELLFLPKADQKVAAVSAASILAKTHRDAYMFEIAKLYPGYGFGTNVGYGTPAHRAGLARLGTCDIHRMSCSAVKKASKVESGTAKLYR